MARKLLKRYLPDHQKVRTHKHVQFLGRLLHDPNLWHLNRHSAAGAVALGLFMAFMPIPLQTIPAAILAVYFRVNLPITLALVWMTNPLTMAPVFYITYKVGSLFIGGPAEPIAFELSAEWFKASVSVVWAPFLVGSFVVAIASSVIGYFSLRLLWQWHVVREWERRKQRRAARKRNG